MNRKMYKKLMTAAIALATAGTMAIAVPEVAAAATPTPPTHSIVTSKPIAKPAPKPIAKPASKPAARPVAATTKAEAYARNLLKAWTEKNREEAEKYGTAKDVKSLFDRPSPGTKDWQLQAVRAEHGMTIVLFRDRVNDVAVSMTLSDALVAKGADHAVTDIRYSGHVSQARPNLRAAEAYADSLVRAWGAGNRAEAGKFGTEAVVKALFAEANPGGKDWMLYAARVERDGYAVMFRDLAKKEAVSLRIDGALLGKTGAKAVTGVRFESTELPGKATVKEAETYAGSLITAWGAGKEAEADKYATAAVVKELFKQPKADGKDWDLHEARADGGAYVVMFRNSKTHEDVSLHIDGAMLAKHADRAVVEVDFSGK